MPANLFGMKVLPFHNPSRIACLASVLIFTLSIPSAALHSQTASASAQATPDVPDWALPSAPNHKQYAPPANFHRPTKNFETPLGIFNGQSDIGGPLVPGNASYDASTKQYTINSAGYNIWYTRDEFRYVWKKMSGDVSLAADVKFPVPQDAPRDRKTVLVIRQDLEDDSKEIMAGEHDSGMVHLAQRARKNALMKDMEYRISGSLLPGVMPKRIGIEKHGEAVALFISVQGEPMHQLGPPIEMHFDGPFYVGIGFCSHYPIGVDTGVFSNVVLENSAGKLK